jgi:hypothetical protein
MVDEQISCLGEDRYSNAFGHRRALDLLFHRAEAWMSSARKRGIQSSRVSESLIRFLWRPSTVIRTESVPVTKEINLKDVRYDEPNGRLWMAQKLVAEFDGLKHVILKRLAASQEWSVAIADLQQLVAPQTTRKLADLVNDINEKLRPHGIEISGTDKRKYQLRFCG